MTRNFNDIKKYDQQLMLKYFISKYGKNFLFLSGSTYTILIRFNNPVLILFSTLI